MEQNGSIFHLASHRISSIMKKYCPNWEIIFLSAALCEIDKTYFSFRNYSIGNIDISFFLTHKFINKITLSNKYFTCPLEANGLRIEKNNSRTSTAEEAAATINGVEFETSATIIITPRTEIKK